MHLSCASKLSWMSVLVSGLQKLVIITILIAGPCPVALAQVPSSESTGQGLSPADADDQGPLSRLTVTGYVVPRIGEGPEPVTTLDQDFITKQGDQTVADVLLRLPQNFASFTPALNAGNSTAEGGSAVNLYGLGANATLVLIDGRRQASYPFAQFGTESFVDLDCIPLAAVDRIEVLKDGASAIYGSDAVAGVVNILLKDEYQGSDLKFYYGISQRGDYEVYHISAVSGFGEKLGENSKFSVLATFDYYGQSPVMAQDRSYSSNLLHSQFGSYFDQAQTNGTAGYFGDAAGNTYTVIPGTKGPQITQNDFIINGPSNLLLNSKDIQLIPREQRYGTYVKLKYEPTSWLKFYEEFSYERNEEVNSFYGSQPTQADPITIPANNPYNPFGIPLQPLGQTLTEIGPQTQDAVIKTYRTVSGATLFLPKNWIVDFSFLYAESDGDATGSNEVSASKLNEALAGTLPGYIGQFYNPFVDQGVVGNPNGRLADAIRITQFQDVRSSLTTWALRGGGELFDLPGGPVTLGLGAEYRSDDYISRVDKYTASFDVIGGGAAINGGGKRYVHSAYYEVSIPILGEKWSWPGARALQLIISERYDNYSDFGSTEKPKFALLFKPFDDLTLRATYSEGYRAPSLTELFSGTSYSFQNLVDPKNPSLGEASYEVRTSGNPQLKAETSYGYFASAVWSPGSNDPQRSWWGWANGFSAYVEYFQIQKGNQISLLNAQQLLNQENLFPGLVVRDANGSIKYVNDPFVNLGEVLVDGISFGASYSTKEYNWGKIELETDWTYLYNYAVQPISNNSAIVSGFGNIVLQPSPVIPEQGTYTLPEIKSTSSIFYTKTLFGIDLFRTGLTLNYTGPEHDVLDNFYGVLGNASVQPNGLVHEIGSFTTLDWQISYEFGKPIEIAPETPQPGYGKDGKRLAGEAAIAPKPEGAHNSWIRYWLAGSKITFGINNIFDTPPPFADTFFGYDPQTANPIGRYFYFELEKKL
jgi:iron complex outermembrane receptor protein